MALTVDYRETIANRIKSDPEFARALLDEAASMMFNGEAEAARLLMRDLTHGLVGFEGLAKATGTPSKSLHRMLSKDGNPGMNALSEIFQQLTQATLHAPAVVHVVPAPTDDLMVA
ncbi:DNA-binding protein [Dyella subtropica]|uniref:helix-turn-helix domain-containing transcriptional regulator n=1 Tax=Dyella subtropica TaxID=2992127 RepID=UPI002250AB78|nr:transcriptional regulator [Dyella subtropica]